MSYRIERSLLETPLVSSKHLLSCLAHSCFVLEYSNQWEVVERSWKSINNKEAISYDITERNLFLHSVCVLLIRELSRVAHWEKGQPSSIGQKDLPDWRLTTYYESGFTRTIF